MRLHVIRLAGLWVWPLLLIIGVATAASDLRLVDAVAIGDIDSVRALVADNIDVN